MTYWEIIFLIVLIFAVVWLRIKQKPKKERLKRINFENALKFLYHFSEQGKTISIEGLQRALHIKHKVLMQIISRLKDNGLVFLDEKELVITEEGKNWALQIVRAHRLWETYLADETDLPLEQIHIRAEKK